MIKSIRLFSVFVCTALVCNVVTAKENVGGKSNSGDGNAKAAGCAPGVEVREMAFNNVRTLIETPGTMWQDRARGRGAYFVPAPEPGELGPSSIFAGALWMGGVDPAGNLKLAAVQFRQDGNDFWPGPLTTDGSAEITPDVCSQYDEHYYMSRQMVEMHRLYFQRVADDIANGTSTVNDPPFDEQPYSIPEEILNWPAHGNVALGQASRLAPFRDNDHGNGTPDVYEPESGDYPWYDLDQTEEDCLNRNRTAPVPLFGDETLWWVFNDKGNIHTETQGQPIGMEIKSQAFAFNTQDEINSMTFYNYTLINRGTQTLNSTFFGQWVDADLGNAQDDYVGCDVQRGLGYAYNGDNTDEDNAGAIGYGTQPPAVGIDFFEGPYQDSDGMDNPGPRLDSLETQISYNEAFEGNGIPYIGIGIGYGDGIVDNERYGMRRFVYYNNINHPVNGNPQNPEHYYNLLRGIWLNGDVMTYGGDGTNTSSIPAQYMFPGDTDPVHWGTYGVDPGTTEWTETGEGNPVGDRRFLQSAGPFTLTPGDFNNITVGVVWARASSGGPFASVQALRVVDDKAQALFDNCFRILDGPDAPDLTYQELDKEIILYLSNDIPTSNNYRETYEEFDPTIPPFTIEFDEEGQQTGVTENDQFYHFEGYQIYQLRHEDVDVSEITDINQARLLFQVDLRNDIAKLINYEYDQDLELPVPQLMANGANEGLQHSFRVTRDLFADEDDRLINFKRYYYVAIAYASNQFAPFDVESGSGQQYQYLAGRQSSTGAINPITAIPHIPIPEAGGTVMNSDFGDTFQITRIEGQGNGRNALELTQASINKIMDGPPWRAEELTYTTGNAPVRVRVVDPLNVQPGDFELRFFNEVLSVEDGVPVYDGDINEAQWMLVNTQSDEVIYSQRAIDYGYEQIIPEYGISIDIEQYEYAVNEDGETRAELLSWELEFANNEPWLDGIRDTDDFTLQNWIQSGRSGEEPDPDLYGPGPCYNILGPNGEPQVGGAIDPGFFGDLPQVDEDKVYAGIANGIIAPFRLVRAYDCGPSPLRNSAKEGESGSPDRKQSLSELFSVDLVFTPNKDLWTRVPVIEMQSDPSLAQGGAAKLQPRAAASVDKNGNPDPNGSTEPSDDPNHPNFINATGMGWFPGYAINVETGERLNMAFGEDSYLAADNGNDMLWNPTSRIFGVPGNEPLFGGQHYIYIFRNNRGITERVTGTPIQVGGAVPMYDYGAFVREQLTVTGPPSLYRSFWKNATWVMSPLAFELNSVEEGLIPSEARLKIRVAKPYEKYAPLVELGQIDYEEVGSVLNPLNPDLLEESENDWYPMYEFSIDEDRTLTEVHDVAEEALSLINIVPNPYHAFNAYETSRIDNRVKFVNLPQECTIKIYNLSGTLIRTLGKDNPQTFLDWDMNNEARIPIASGVYIMHVDVPDVGERVLKWFCVMRPADLQNF